MKTEYELHMEAENDNLRDKIKELEAENARLRQQLNSANSQIQILNRVIAGDIE